jgi:hypothetical protein
MLRYKPYKMGAARASATACEFGAERVLRERLCAMTEIERREQAGLAGVALSGLAQSAGFR